ncbi:MAG: hypothetical protein LW875_07010 [Proteobacteria bacterium]|nr:hypothetical protein [Pseudomonadota bacterium]
MRLFILVLLFSQFVWASSERMGEFGFSELTLSPRWKAVEPSDGGMTLAESWLSFYWKRDETLSAEFGVGTSDLVKPAILFIPSELDGLQLVKAFLQAKTDYMNFRAGLIPVPLGYEGSVPEWEWIFPLTLARESHWFIRRDYGLEAEVIQTNYSARILIHNGESAESLDARSWITGLWSLQNEGYFFNLSGSVGGTKSQSTAGSLAPGRGFQFDPNKNAKIRLGVLSFGRDWKRNLFLVESGRGEILQDEKKPFQWGQVDWAWNYGGDASFLARYEWNQSNAQSLQSKVDAYGIGFAVSSSDRLSQITLFGRKVHERPQIQNDELWLLLRLNSNVLEQ